MKYEVVWKFEPRRVIVSTPEEAFFALGLIAAKHLLKRDEELEVERPPKEWVESTRVRLFRLKGDPVKDTIAYIRPMFTRG